MSVQQTAVYANVLSKHLRLFAFTLNNRWQEIDAATASEKKRMSRLK